MQYKILRLIGFILLILVSCTEKSVLYSFELIPVKIDGKWGYIDKLGKTKISPQFEGAYYFSDHIALVKNSENKCRFIDEEGKFIINFSYKDATSFFEGIAFVVNENDYPQAIDKTGKVLFKLNSVDYVNTFHEGLALAKSKNLYGFIDKRGKAVISYQFYDASSFFDGMAPVAIQSTKKNEEKEINYGYIDKEGKYVINPQFKEAYPFHDELALVFNGEKYGFIDKSGKYIINPQFDDAGNFSEGLARIKQGDKWGFIDKQGKIAINPQFESSKDFRNGLACVANSKESWGYINKKGSYEINPQFPEASSFMSDFAFVFTNKKAGLISRNGQYVINPQFEDVVDHYNYFKMIWDLGETQLVKSDFFDAEKNIEDFFEGSNNESLRGLTRTTTAAAIYLDSVANDGIKEFTSNSLYTEKTEEINEDIEISQKIYSFKSKVSYYQSQYYYGYYIGSKKKYNFSSLLKSAFFEFKLDSFGRGSKKENYFADKLVAFIRDKFNASLSDDVTLENSSKSLANKEPIFVQDPITTAPDTTKYSKPLDKKNAFQNKKYELESTNFVFSIATSKGYVRLLVSFK